MASHIALAPGRLLLPLEPASSATISSGSVGSCARSYASFSLLLQPARRRLRRSSRAVIAAAVDVEEDSQRYPEKRLVGRRGRGGGRPWDGGNGQTRNLPPWKSETSYRQSQETERDDGTVEELFEWETPSSIEQDGDIDGERWERKIGRREYAGKPNAVRNAKPRFNARGEYGGKPDAVRNAKSRFNMRAEYAGKPNAVRNAKPRFNARTAESARPQFKKLNSQPTPWEQAPREGHNGFNAEADEQNETNDSNVLPEKSAMARIVEKLRSVQKSNGYSEQVEHEGRPFSGTAGSLSLPKPNQDLFSIAKNWTTPDHSIPEPGRGVLDTKFPWERDEASEEEEKMEQVKRVRAPTLAELTIPVPELRRLRNLSMQLTSRIKIGKLGVTDNVAETIKDKWRTCEVVKVKCEGPPALNMKKTHEDLERKTGGLVIWRAGSVAVVYRGSDDRQVTANGILSSLERRPEGLTSSEHEEESSYITSSLDEPNEAGSDLEADDAIKTPVRTRRSVAPDPHIDREYEMEVESILQELGPRYEEWTGSRPLPVDADLLPASIPNYRPPFRLLPYGVKPTLSNADLTNLRRLARPLAPHFVLGRNKGQQGLAAAMVKLWEKSEIAKVAVKRGVQNTNNERMAEEIKRVTGGVLLARDKQFITFYRGKDFLPQKVAAALSEREAMVRALQEEEEKARADRSIAVQLETGIQPSVAVLAEKSSPVEPSFVKLMNIEDQRRLQKEAARARRMEMARQIERKVAVASAKKEKAQRELEKVEEFLKPIARPADMETITEEERFMFRKLGLRMHAFLLVGRRGVFDGVVQNMHLHWKHRELVKIMVKEKDPMQLQETARMLEYESGGVLVAVVATSKGQAIIVYRGKNYERPSELRPRNLLTKRKALKRSIEIQRRGAISKHIQTLEKEIANMKDGLSKMDMVEHGHLKEDSSDDLTGASIGRLEGSDDTEIQQGEEPLMVGEDDTASDSSEDQTAVPNPELQRKKLERLCRLGPIFRAEALTNRERLRLRKEALNLSKASQFHVGKSNVLPGLARAIRTYFMKHALVKIGVKGRGHGTSIQHLVHELEDLTGGVLVSQETNKIIMYRGWPSGEEMPTSEIYDVLSPELRDALEAEEDDWDDDTVDDEYIFVNDDDASDMETDEEEDNEDYIAGMQLDEGDLSDVDGEEDNEYEYDITGMHPDEGDFPDVKAEEDYEDEYDSVEMHLGFDDGSEDEANEDQEDGGLPQGIDGFKIKDEVVVGAYESSVPNNEQMDKSPQGMHYISHNTGGAELN